jgi:DNA-binding transcriptional ArsR family regulator
MAVSTKAPRASGKADLAKTDPAKADCVKDDSALAPMGMPSPQLLEEFGQFFRLLSEPARLQLLCHLKQGPMDVASLMEATGFSQSHISRQLGQLLRAGLVSCERDGVRLIYRADDQLVLDLCALVQNRLRQRLEAQLQHLRGG